MMEAVKEFEAVCKEYEPKVSAYIRNHVSNPDDVKALSDDVFQKLLQNKEAFRKEPDSVSRLVYITTKQTVEEYFAEIPEETQTLDAKSLDRLADALEQLDVRSRDIIILHYYADKTLEEIAAAMDVSYAETELLNKEALDRLQKLIEL